MYISPPRSSRKGSHYFLVKFSVSLVFLSLLSCAPRFDPFLLGTLVRVEPLSTTLLPPSLALYPYPPFILDDLSNLPASTLATPPFG
jgi:hypothetical protein